MADFAAKPNMADGALNERPSELQTIERFLFALFAHEFRIHSWVSLRNRLDIPDLSILIASWFVRSVLHIYKCIYIYLYIGLSMCVFLAIAFFVRLFVNFLLLVCDAFWMFVDVFIFSFFVDYMSYCCRVRRQTRAVGLADGSRLLGYFLSTADCAFIHSSGWNTATFLVL